MDIKKKLKKRKFKKKYPWYKILINENTIASFFIFWIGLLLPVCFIFLLGYIYAGIFNFIFFIIVYNIILSKDELWFSIIISSILSVNYTFFALLCLIFPSWLSFILTSLEIILISYVLGKSLLFDTYNVKITQAEIRKYRLNNIKNNIKRKRFIKWKQLINFKKLT